MRENCPSLPADAVEKLLELRDGNVALLYLYALKNGGEVGEEEAARSLCRTRREIAEAMQRLCALGLLPERGATLLPLPADELPEYTAFDIARRSEEDEAFAAVVAEAQRTLGKTLSTADLNILFGIYDHLGLPAEVIFLLLHYCIEEYQRKNGPGRLPRMKWVENEAYLWFNNEIITVNRAEEYLALQASRRSELSEIKRTLQIRDRDLTATEKRYIDAWLDLGFSAEALSLAYDRTIVKTGKLTWKYMDGIVRSWNTKGLKTARDIIAGDARSGAASASGGDMEYMKRLLEKVSRDVT